MEKRRYILVSICVVSILLLLLFVLVCAGLSILILSLVNNNNNNNNAFEQNINLASNQTLQLELKAENCPSYKQTYNALILSISNPTQSKFTVYLNANSNQSDYNNSCFTPPGDKCAITLDNSEIFSLTIQSLQSTETDRQRIQLILTCDSNTDPLLIVGTVLLATGVFVGIGLLLFIFIILFDWCYFQDSSNAVYG